MSTHTIRRLIAATVLSGSLLGLGGLAGSPASAGHPGIDGPGSFTDVPRPECPPGERRPERERQPETDPDPDPDPVPQLVEAHVLVAEEGDLPPTHGPFGGPDDFRDVPRPERCPDPEPEPRPERNPDVVVARPNFTG
jgi:hypothetical protein